MATKKPPYKENKAAPTRDISELFLQVKKAREGQKSESTLLSVLAQLKVSSPILVEATEQVRIRKVIEWFKSQLKLSGTPEDYQLEFGHALGSADIVRAIKNFVSFGSLFSTERLLVILDGQQLKAAPAKLLAEILSVSGSDVLTLIFTSDAKSCGAISEIAGKSGAVFSLAPLKGRDRLTWLEREIARNFPDVRLAADARQFLIQLNDCGLDELYAAVDIAGLYVVPAKEITQRDLQTFLDLNQQGSIFSMVEKAARGDVLGAEQLLNVELEKGAHPLQTLGFLTKAYRTLLAGKDGGRGAPADLKNPWFTKQLGAAGTKLDESRLIDSIAVLARLDRELKDSKLHPEGAIKQAVAELSLP